MNMVTIHRSKFPNTILSLKNNLLYRHYEKHKNVGNTIVLISIGLIAFQPPYSMAVTPYEYNTDYL